MDTVGDSTIRFDEKGCCNYCTEALARSGPQKKDGFEQLEKQFTKIREECKYDSYDVLVGVSGGLDSSYILYLGHQYGLRMLGIHVDDGLDTPVAKKNVQALCETCNLDLINLQPDAEQYRDLTLSFFKAQVPDLAIPQDNLILKGITDAVKTYHLKYLLHGSNQSMESILQQGNGYTATDDVHIRAIQKQFSGKPIDKLHLLSTFENSILRHVRRDVCRVTPLNLIDYRFESALRELQEFCGYEYYGAKHHESVLTRFLQGYWLPVKFYVDKRKSHLSSMIVSDQITRDEALEKLAQPHYATPELLKADCKTLTEFLGISREEFNALLDAPPRSHEDYPKSLLSNRVVPAMLKLRFSLLKR